MHKNSELARILRGLDLGTSIAEQDEVLQAAQVKTSVYTDLLLDRVDLIPGTKGSGKSALYRMFVAFESDSLLEARKVVVAHGVHHHGDSVFLAFKEEFGNLTEDDFVDFWCIYLVSLAHEQFVKASGYHRLLKKCDDEILAFRQSCEKACIPDIVVHKTTLKAMLGWVLSVLKAWKPSLQYAPPDDVGTFTVKLGSEDPKDVTEDAPPQYIAEIRSNLEAILEKANLGLWFMIDRLDEVFERRSRIETLALRGLLRTIRVFEASRIRVKVFIRDDVYDQIVAAGDGFTALTHVTARQADVLRWSEDQILTMVVKRLFANRALREYLDVDVDRLEVDRDYQKEAFYLVFPREVGNSKTLRWIINNTADGRRIVTPRDVIDLLTRARQRQLDTVNVDLSSTSHCIIDSPALRYGLSQLSIKKRTTFLEAECPNLWPAIAKLVGLKTVYGESAIRRIFGKSWESTVKDLLSIGLLRKGTKNGVTIYSVPALYKAGLELKQGRLN